MDLSLITNKPALARLAEDAGIDRILIDLERIGKAERQINRGLFLSDHCFDDIEQIRCVLQRTKLMVRVDPLHHRSKQQIKNVIEAGADFVMLPYFHRLDQAAEFLDYVGTKRSYSFACGDTGSSRNSH